MKVEHVISDEVLEIAQLAINRNENWMAYNNSLYFIDKSDVFFFRTEGEANEFASNNMSDYDHYTVIYVDSVLNLFKQIPYGESFTDKLASNPDANGLYNKGGNAFTDALIEHIEKQQLLNNSKNNFMNQQNLDYLKENLRFMGFGDKLHPDLEKNIQQGFPEFVLKMQSEFSSKKIDTTLSFKKSDQSDMYFFNRFDAHLPHRNDASKDVQQTFYLNKGHGVTLKEAFNLLEGRAVHKELSGKEGKFNAWIQLDFKEKEENGNYKTKQYHQNYGYDLETSLKAFPIKELQNEQQKERLLMSLQKGNVQSVTMVTSGRDQMFFVEANPQYKTVTVYDDHMKMLNKEQRNELVAKGGISNEKVNHQEVKPNRPEQVREIKEANQEKTQKTEITKPDKEKSKDEKLSEASAESKSTGKTKKEKTKEVKNLLPQKEKSSTKKGLRA